MSDPNAPPSQSLVAGKYQLGQLIGRGGMGSVWEGRHVSLGTRVAVKFIEKEYSDSDEARKRFHNEAKTAATIQSKYAVQIYDHGVTDDGRPYIVMELLEGEGLDKRLERLGQLSLQEVARVLTQVCRALQRAHEAGIIHRDLKLENIFIQRSLDDEDEIAKVLDFGIAKIRSVDGTTLSSSTKTGAVLGTPFYMSPEQARGLREIDHRTDLWSLGVIAYKCLIGVLPFDGQSLGDLLVKICTAPLPVPSEARADLPPAFDAWFQRALERDPAARFGSANELADALAFAAGLSVKRGPASFPQSAPKAALAISGTSATEPGLGATSAPLTHTSPGTTKRTSAAAVAGVAALTLMLGAGGAVFWSSRTPTKVASAPPEPSQAAAPQLSASTAPAAVPTTVTAVEPTPIEPAAVPPAAPKARPGTKGKAGSATTVKAEVKASAKPDPKSEPEPVKPTKPKQGDPGF